MLKKTIVLSLLLLIVAVLAGYYFGTERCQDQSEYDYSPYCVKCYKQSAENGDAGAAYNLALFFEGRDAATSNNWVRIAAERGEMRAVSRVLAECGDGKQFSSQYAEKILSNAVNKDSRATALDAMYFYLGGSCGPVNIEQARSFYIENADDDLKLCPVALKYGEVVQLEKTKDADKKNALELLQKCLHKADPDSVTFQEASKLLSSIRTTTSSNK